MISYADLNQVEQDAVSEAKLLVQKSLPVKESVAENDVWAVFVDTTLQTVNLYPPQTDYAVGSTPKEWMGVVVLGCRCQAYKYLETYWLEVPDLSSAGVPFANRTSYMERWKTLYEQLEPTFRRAVGNLKVKYFHGSAMIVSTYQPDVLLRGMWEWPRYWRY